MEARAPAFCTIFPGYQDFHFFKDPGQIPYRFSKLGYDVSLVCYSKGQMYTRSEAYLKIVKINDTRLSRKFNSGIIKYLLFNSRKIDILHVFHLCWSSLLFLYVYKVLNSKGFAYLKLDICAFTGDLPWEEDPDGTKSGQSTHGNLKSRLKRLIIRNFFFQNVDLWSVEDEYSKEILEAKYPFMQGKLITVYNGHTSDLPGSLDNCRADDKEDIILTAGRLGTFQKATEVLLDAFITVAARSKYVLHLAGPVESVLVDYLDKYRKANPGINEKVIIHGPLNRNELYKLYCRSKILCMPSRFEGMAIVFPEAMYYRNAIVTTNFVSLKYLIDKFRIGITVDKDSPAALADALLRLTVENELREEMAQRASDLTLSLLNWDNIIRSLHSEITDRLNIRRG